MASILNRLLEGLASCHEPTLARRRKVSLLQRTFFTLGKMDGDLLRRHARVTEDAKLEAAVEDYLAAVAEYGDGVVPVGEPSLPWLASVRRSMAAHHVHIAERASRLAEVYLIEGNRRWTAALVVANEATRGCKIVMRTCNHRVARTLLRAGLKSVAEVADTGA